MARLNRSAAKPHPEPDVHFSAVDLPIRQLRSSMFRIHRSNFNAKFFGKTLSNRFDSPDQSYGVMYLGLDEYCCFIETFGQQTGKNFVTIEELSLHSISLTKLSRDLQLVDISGAGLARIGADNRLTTGSHLLAQTWSKAFYEHPSSVDGIYFRSCHDPDRLAVALFERAKDAIMIEKSEGLLSLSFQNILTEIMDRYNFALG